MAATTTINTTLNATLEALINATFTYKKKVDGTMQEFSGTMLSERFKKLPTAKNCPTMSEDCKEVLKVLKKAYEWAERHCMATTDYQRNKCADSKQEYIQKFLALVGMDTGIGNVDAISTAAGLKCQTYKGIQRGGYVSETTFMKNALYLAYYCQTTGSFCQPKGKKTASSDIITDIANMSEEQREAAIDEMMKKLLALKNGKAA